MENDEKERDITSCYGTECGHCSEPCQWYACGMDVIREKREDEARRFTVPFNEKIEVPDLDVSDINWKNDDVLHALNRFVFMMREHPVLFKALIDRLYDNKTQTDVARERGITRQAVSKERKNSLIKYIESELGMKAPIAKREKLLGLTGKEFEVYKKLFIDGCTLRSASIQLGIPTTTVFRVKQVLRRKLAKNGTRKKPSQKKS